jgi:hypothetical protein
MTDYVIGGLILNLKIYPSISVIGESGQLRTLYKHGDRSSFLISSNKQDML